MSAHFLIASAIVCVCVCCQTSGFCQHIKWKVEYQCTFNLHLSHYGWGWSSFHMGKRHMYSMFMNRLWFSIAHISIGFFISSLFLEAQFLSCDINCRHFSQFAICLSSFLWDLLPCEDFLFLCYHAYLFVCFFLFWLLDFKS